MTLLQHQQDMVNLAMSRTYALWYSEMGTGKTYALLTYLSNFDGMRLIICPKSALSVYAEDRDKFGIICDITTLDKGTSKDKQHTLDRLHADGYAGIVVVNYATARLLRFDHIPFTAAACDEAQKVGTHNSKTSLSLARQLAHVPRKVAMTGTPYQDGLSSVFGIVRWLDPVIYDNPRKHPGSTLLGDWHTFMFNFCQTYRHNGVTIVSGYKNQDKLAEILKPFTIQIKADSVLDLPPAVDVVRKANISGQTRRVYNELADNAASEVGDSAVFAPHILQRIIRLQQLVCSGQLELDDGTVHTFNIDERIAVLRQIHDELGPNQPYVIFTRYKRDIEIVRSTLDEDVALLTGDTDTHQDWRDGKYRVLIANIASGSTGVRLERAHHIVFWSVGYSATDYLQARGRIRRNGQTASRVFFHHIVTENTIDEQIYKTLADKLKASGDMDSKL